MPMMKTKYINEREREREREKRERVREKRGGREIHSVDMLVDI